jgi:hypothetical protein
MRNGTSSTLQHKVAPTACISQSCGILEKPFSPGGWWALHIANKVDAIRGMNSDQPYSPSRWCDRELDEWCTQHCDTAARSNLLRARQPMDAPYMSSKVGGAFYCYRTGPLHQLANVTMTLSAHARVKCSRGNEASGLASALLRCLTNHSVSDASLSSSSKDGRKAAIAQLGATLAARRQRVESGVVAGLSIPHAVPPAASEAFHRYLFTPAASEAWLRLPRDRSAQAAAARCLANGKGRWAALPIAAGEPYLLSTDLFPGFNYSRWWWGACDDDLRHGVVRPPRAAVMYAWQAEGDGCEQV